MKDLGETYLDPDLANIASIEGQVTTINERSVREYAPIVEDILRTEYHDPRLIEWTLDGPLDFCGHPPVLELYRRPCSHDWEIDPTPPVADVEAYREMWDSKSPAEAEGAR